MSFACFLQFPPKPRGKHWGLDRARARQNPLLLGERGERCPNAQRDWGESPRFFFSFLILQSHISQAQRSLVTAEAATDIALGLHRNPKLSNKRTLFSDQVSDEPKKVGANYPCLFTLCIPTTWPQEQWQSEKVHSRAGN